MAPFTMGDMVRLNVGGHEYITSSSTLRKVSDSMLARQGARLQVLIHEWENFAINTFSTSNLIEVVD